MTLQRFQSLQPAAALTQLQALLSPKGPAGDRDPNAAPQAWYRIDITNQAEAEIFIYDHIGTFGITANDFIGELREIKASKIALHINSEGGDVFDGIAIFNALARHKATITAWIDGIAASAASFIAMAGDEIVMASHSQMMIHEAHGLAIGPADDMRKMADLLDKSSDNIASIYAERTGGSTEEWRQRMKDETWFSDSEAVEVGLADRMDGEEKEATAARLAARVAARARVFVNGEEVEREPDDGAPIPFPLGLLQAVQKGTSEIVQKETLPDFDFLSEVRKGTAQAA